MLWLIPLIVYLLFWVLVMYLEVRKQRKNDHAPLTGMSEQEH